MKILLNFGSLIAENTDAEKVKELLIDKGYTIRAAYVTESNDPQAAEGDIFIPCRAETDQEIKDILDEAGIDSFRVTSIDGVDPAAKYNKY